MRTNRNLEMGMVAALYTRVSTDMQVQADSLATQEKVLREHARYHQLKIFSHYSDAGISGSSTVNRPEFQRMMEDAKKKKFNVVVVTKIDRISRNLQDLLSLIETLEDIGIAFVSISQQFDTSTSMGRLTLNILGSFAQFEREMIAERVREHMLVRAKEGKWNGGIVPYGYKVKDKKMVIRDDEAGFARKIFEIYTNERSIRHVAIYLNDHGAKPRYAKSWSPTSIRRTLENPAYYGAFTYNKRKGTSSTSVPRPRKEWIIVEGVLPPLVTKEEWLRVQQILRNEGGLHHRNKRSDYLFSGLLKCGQCGGGMTGYTHPKENRNGDPWAYYRCSWRLTKGKSACSGLTLDLRKSERKIIEALVNLSIDPSPIIKKTAEMIDHNRLLREHEEDHIQPRMNRLKRVEKGLERILDAFQDGLLDKEEVANRTASLKSEKAALELEIAEFHEKSGGYKDTESRADTTFLKQYFGRFGAGFAGMKILDRKELLAEVVKRIVAMPDDRLRIHFRLEALLRAFGLSETLVKEIKDDEVVLLVNASEDIHMLQDFSEMRTFGERVKWLRMKNGLSKKDLARHLGVHACTVANWEVRNMKPHIHATLRKVAEFFGVRVSILTGVKPVAANAPTNKKMRYLRACLGMSQLEMAGLLDLADEQYLTLEAPGEKRSGVDDTALAELIEKIPASMLTAVDLDCLPVAREKRAEP